MKLIKNPMIVALGVALLAVSIAGAGAPRLIPYQGRLTDAADVPVTDGAHLVKFIIYDASANGTILWNSNFQPVTTEDGLFDYTLGSVVPLPNNLFFDTVRYLGITIGVDPEISPRMRFETTPYSLHSSFADNAGQAELAYVVPWTGITGIPAGFADGVDDASDGDITEVVAGSGLSGGGASGSVTLSIPTGGISSAMIANSSVTSDDIATDAVGSIQIQVNAVGSSEVANNSLTASDLASNSVTAAEMGPNSVGASEMQSNAIGTFEVIDNSLSSADLSDEPGLAHAFDPSNLIGPLPAWDGSSLGDDVYLTRSLDAPRSGYIVAIASGYLRHDHSTGVETWGRISLGTSGDNTQVDFDNTAWTHLPATAGAGQYNQSWTVTKTMAVSAGVTTFYLRGAAGFANDIFLARPHLVLMFFPTAYGTVTNSAQPTNPQGPEGTSSSTGDATGQN